MRARRDGGGRRGARGIPLRGVQHLRHADDAGAGLRARGHHEGAIALGDVHEYLRAMETIGDASASC